MMNYRHAFHAGNFADVVKHAVLTRIVEHLKAKEKAFRVIDTHAGRGLYDLTGEEAGRTGEWRDGIARLLDAPLPADAAALLAPYLDAVRAENPDGGVRAYPGSPALVRRLLRRQDRLTAVELHPEDAAALRVRFAGDIQVRVIHLDGWLSLGAHLPPKERRGVVLVDPPFEEAGEFGRIVSGLARAHRRWPGGIYALWYPIKDRKAVDGFRKDLQASGIAKVLDIELTVRPTSETPRLDGSGMIVVNPPYRLDDELKAILPTLAELLSQASGGGWRVEWLRREQSS
jgi:23S rRNA (adenine2030-N6)-methyltransferase